MNSMCFLIYNRIFRRSAFGVGLLLLLSSLPLAGYAQSASGDDVPPLHVSDLTPSEFHSLSALAPTLLGASATGNITNDVAAILDILNTHNTRYGLRVVPMVASDSSFSFMRYLLSMMYENGNSVSMGSALTPSRSYLYEIQRALYGQSGYPQSVELSLLPFLWGSFGFTNDVSSILSELNGSSVNSGYSLAEFLRDSDSLGLDVSDILSEFQSFNLSFGSMSYTGGSEPYSFPGLTVYDEALDDVWTESIPSWSESGGLITYDPAVHSSVDSIGSLLADIKIAIESLSGSIDNPPSFNSSVPSTSIGGGEVSEMTFDSSSIGSVISGYTSAIMTNAVPASAFAVNTNFVVGLTNATLPSTQPILDWSESSLSFLSSMPSTNPQLSIFSSFTYNGVSIPGMALDLSDSRLSSLSSKCHDFCSFIYACLGAFLCILRARSFVENVAQGFSLTFGDMAMEAGHSLGDSSSGSKPFGGAM